MEIIEWLLIFVLIFGMVAPFIVIFLLYWTDRKTSRFIYFDSEDTCRTINKEAKDGKVVIDDDGVQKHFFLDDTKPKIIKTFFGHKPFYELKWNSVSPLKLDFKSNTLTDGKITPENLGQLKKSTIIEKLMNPKTDNMNIIIWLIIGAVIGILLGYIIGKGF